MFKLFKKGFVDKIIFNKHNNNHNIINHNKDDIIDDIIDDNKDDIIDDNKADIIDVNKDDIIDDNKDENKENKLTIDNIIRNLHSILNDKILTQNEIIDIINDTEIDNIYMNGKTILHYFCENEYSHLYIEIGRKIVKKMSKNFIKKVDTEYNMALFYCYNNNLEQLGSEIIDKIIN